MQEQHRRRDQALSHVSQVDHQSAGHEADDREHKTWLQQSQLLRRAQGVCKVADSVRRQQGD
jgi:hypothetical protein